MPATPRTDTDGYDPPASPEDHPWFVLAAKTSLAMMLAYGVAIALGFPDPTYAIIAAAYLATTTPLASGKQAIARIGAVLVGAALGVLGAYLAQWMSGVPILHVGLVGLIVGVLASRSSSFLFAAVVGVVVAFSGAAGGDPIIEIAAVTICLVLIGCLCGPAVVWAVEHLRMQVRERRG